MSQPHNSDEDEEIGDLNNHLRELEVEHLRELEVELQQLAERDRADNSLLLAVEKLFKAKNFRIHSAAENVREQAAICRKLRDSSKNKQSAAH